MAPPPPAAEGTVVVGSLANSYATYQLRLSARLAREHHGLRSVKRAEPWVPTRRRATRRRTALSTAACHAE